MTLPIPLCEPEGSGGGPGARLPAAHGPLAAVHDAQARGDGVGRRIYAAVLKRPLLLFYLRAPAWLGWQGMRQEEVCARLTGAPALHWQAHAAECEELVLQRAEAVEAFLVACVYGATLLWLYSRLVRGVGRAVEHTGASLARAAGSCLRRLGSLARRGARPTGDQDCVRCVHRRRVEAE